MKQRTLLTTLCALAMATSVQAQQITFDFEDGTDQGFGHKFSDDASESFPIVDIAGSHRMEVLRNGDFQEAERSGSDAAFLAAINAATANPSGYVISYDYYIDTSLGDYGTYLQLGTYINSGNDPYPYVQDFSDPYDLYLDGTQTASGNVFSGTVTETLTDKYGALDPAFLSMGFARLGLIINGDGADATVYFDNVSIRPVPEPSTFALLGLGVGGLLAVRRRRG